MVRISLIAWSASATRPATDRSVEGYCLHSFSSNEALSFNAANVCPVVSCKSRANLRLSSSCSFKRRCERFCTSAVRSTIASSSSAGERDICRERFEKVHISSPVSGGELHNLRLEVEFCHLAEIKVCSKLLRRLGDFGQIVAGARQCTSDSLPQMVQTTQIQGH